LSEGDAETLHLDERYPLSLLMRCSDPAAKIGALRHDSALFRLRWASGRLWASRRCLVALDQNYLCDAS